MSISARVHYASLALIELAIRSPSKTPVAVREITERHGIPGPFLVQILRTLRSEGWVQSIRGSQGGYRLLVDPEELTLLDVAEAVGCPDATCQTDSTETSEDRLLNQAWSNAADASRKELAKVTIAQIAAGAAKNEEAMFYI